MTTISSPLWSLFLATRRNSSSLIHIKPNKTSFFDGLSLSKRLLSPYLFCFICDLRVFRYYYLFCFWFFVLIWFNLGFWWSIVEGISNRRKTKSIHTPCENFAGHAKLMNHFAWGAKISHTLWINFAHCVKISQPCEIILNTLLNFRRPCEKFRTPNTISHFVRNPKGSVKPFCTPKAISHAVRK